MADTFEFQRIGATLAEMKCTDKEVMVMQIIRTTNLCRGAGTTEDPMRRVTQYWSLDGDLLAERDPFARSAGEKS